MDRVGRIRGQLQNVAGASLLRFPRPATEENPQQRRPARDNLFLDSKKLLILCQKSVYIEALVRSGITKTITRPQFFLSKTVSRRYASFPFGVS